MPESIELYNSLLETVVELIRMIGFAAVFLLMVIIAFYFLPLIISAIRGARGKAVIAIGNIVVVFIAFFSIKISIFLWLILMIASLVIKKKIEGPKMPDIIINQSEENKKEK